MKRISAGFPLGIMVLAGCPLLCPAGQPVPRSAEELFLGSRVWTIHLKFAAAAWSEMEPKGGPGPGGPGRPGFPGRPGGPGMNPASMLVPVFLAGDTDHDGVLSAQEFERLGAGWFARWSTDGVLKPEGLRACLQAMLPPPPFGPPGGPRGPGGPEGGPGRAFLGRDGRNGMSAAMGIEFPYVHANLEFEDTGLGETAARYKGNSTFMAARGSLKRSIKLDLNRFDQDRKFAGQSALNLHNNVMDPSWMNESLAYRLFRDAGVPSPRTSYARVSVTVPGSYDRKYLGLYSIVEEVDKRFAEARFGTAEGAIFKPSTRELFSDLGPDWSRYKQIYDPKTSLTSAQKARVIEFSRFVTQASDEEFPAKLASYLDLDEFARFMAVTVLLSNMDSILQMGQNFYVHLHPQTNRFQFIPWDLDHAFGQFPMAGGQLEALSIDRPWQGRNRFLERVFAVETFRSLYRRYLAEFNTNLFAKDRIAAQVDELARSLRGAVSEESGDKLARFDKAVSGEAVPMSFGPGPGGPRPGFGPGPGGPGGFGGGMMRPVKAFVGPRQQSVGDQLAGKPVAPPDEGRRPGRGPGGPGGFGPAMFLERAFLSALDGDRDGEISKTEFERTFSRWFTAWNSDATGKLTPDQLRTGIERDLMPPMPPMGPRQ